MPHWAVVLVPSSLDMQLRRSIYITFLSSNFANVIQFGVTVLLSRLLSPAEVGIFSITAIFVGITIVFRDFGVSSYLQAEKNLTIEQTRSAMGLLITTSWMLAAFLYFSSDFVAAYYQQPGISRALKVLTLSFMIVPFASYFSSLLARELRADKTAIATSVGTFAYAICCIGLAYAGFSYMSLAWANVANLSATLIAYLFLKPKNIPLLPRFRGWRAPATFGAGAVIGNLFNRLNYSIPDLVIGKVAGAAEVGLYSRGNGLVSIFQQILGPSISYTALPYIAKNHHDNIPLSPLMSKATSYLTGLALPAYLVTAMFPKEILHVLYGSQWVVAWPLVVLLCVQAALQSGYTLAQPALMAIGRPYLSSLYFGVSALMRFGLIFGFGAHDLWSIALALCAADVLTMLVPVWLMKRFLGYSYMEAWKAHWYSVRLCLFMLVFLLGAKLLMVEGWPDLLKLVIVGVIAAVSWLAGIVLIKHPVLKELPAILRRLSRFALAKRLADALDLRCATR